MGAEDAFSEVADSCKVGPKDTSGGGRGSQLQLCLRRVGGKEMLDDVGEGNYQGLIL